MSVSWNGATFRSLRELDKFNDDCGKFLSELERWEQPSINMWEEHGN